VKDKSSFPMNVHQRGNRGHSSSAEGRRLKNVDKKKAPKHQGKSKMGSVVRNVNEHRSKATTSAEGRAFSFGNWPG
jgi:hypothetical protein